MITLIIVLVVVVVLALWVMGIYNSLVRLRNNREQAFGNIDVQLKQRHDLIPNLVATCKGYAAHEASVFEKVTELRANAMGATTINDKIAAENQLSNAMLNLRVAMEAYPQLQASENFKQVMTELADLENKLAATRRFFNGATKELNNAVEVFPNVLFAGMFGFHKEPMFDVGTEERAAMNAAPPKVEF